MKSFARVLLSITLVFLFVQTGFSQKEDIAMNQLYIWNSSQADVTFNLSSDDKNWKPFSLGPNGSKSFNIGSQKCYISIITDGNDQSVDYELDKQQRYQIFWNQDNELWDIAKMAPR